MEFVQNLLLGLLAARRFDGYPDGQLARLDYRIVAVLVTILSAVATVIFLG